MRYDNSSGVVLFNFRVSLKRKPIHKWTKDIMVEAFDKSHAIEIVLYEYPKGVVWEVENMDNAY